MNLFVSNSSCSSANKKERHCYLPRKNFEILHIQKHLSGREAQSNTLIFPSFLNFFALLGSLPLSFLLHFFLFFFPHSSFLKIFFVLFNALPIAFIYFFYIKLQKNLPHISTVLYLMVESNNFRIWNLKNTEL